MILSMAARIEFSRPAMVSMTMLYLIAVPGRSPGSGPPWGRSSGRNRSAIAGCRAPSVRRSRRLERKGELEGDDLRRRLQVVHPETVALDLLVESLDVVRDSCDLGRPSLALLDRAVQHLVIEKGLSLLGIEPVGPDVVGCQPDDPIGRAVEAQEPAWRY